MGLYVCVDVYSVQLDKFLINKITDFIFVLLLLMCVTALSGVLVHVGSLKDNRAEETR